MNVVLITVDSLRADHVGCLGSGRTPNLDRFAKNGLLFTNAISCGPDTPTSVGPLMTSSYVLTYYVLRTEGMTLKTTVDEFEMMRKVMLDIYRYETTVAAMLGKNGYVTGGFHSNPYLSRYYNFGIEFDYFYDSLPMKRYRIKQVLKTVVERNRILYDISWFVYKNVMAKIRSVVSKHYAIPYERAEKINDRVLKWVKSVRGNRLFLWIHYMDVHFPYIPPEDYLRVDLDPIEIVDLNDRMLKNPKSLTDEDVRNLLKLYDGEIEYWDSEFGRLIDELSDVGVLDDALVIVTADHGDEFGEHGDFAHHNAKLYDELIHVPLVMNVGRGVVSSVVSLLDVAPTIAEILGLEKPKTFQGESLITPKREGAFSECLKRGRRVVCYRTEGWKYILDGYRGKEELYNIEEDPGERHDLSGLADVGEFRRKVFEHVERQRRRVMRFIGVRKGLERIRGRL